VAGGRNEPYEINVALYDALQGTSKGPDRWQQQRFLCAHAVMLALEGVPGIYIHSLLATQNDYEKVELTSQNRSINRHKWMYDELADKLGDSSSHHAQCFAAMKSVIDIRVKQPAFHPNAFQAVLHLGDEVFAFWRQSSNRNQSIFCLHNMTDQVVTIPINSINLTNMDIWEDLISGDHFSMEYESLSLPPYGFVWLTNRVVR
jgi:sucrose phosphorylase